MVNFRALALTALAAPFLASASPLLPVPGTDALAPSPTAFKPPSLKAIGADVAEAVATAEASAEADASASIAERDLASSDDLTTDAEMFVFKRRPSDDFRAGADAHVADLHARLRKKRALGLAERHVMPEVTVTLQARGAKQKAVTATCLAPSANQDDITAAFLNGGDNTRVALCPSTTYYITDTIYFTGAKQELYTLGYPTDSTRAIISVTGADQSVAVYGGFNECKGILIRNVAFNGNRPTLGRLPSGAGLLEIGGSAPGQVVSGCSIYEPRGWTCLHVAEGHELSCTNSNLINNQIGPSGDSPNSAYQFNRVMAQYAKLRSTPGALRKRDAIAPGQWADGISLACASSTVRGNTVTDATDGGIVIFGSPGTSVSGNTIISRDRVALGGINMVDKWPWGGSYDGVTVSNNKLITQGSMIKVGIAMGPMVWGVYNQSDGRTWGGLVKGNSFSSTNGYFGFGIGTAGHFSATTTGNNFNGARFNYAISYACFPQWLPPPSGPLVRDPKTTNGTFQAGTVTGDIVLLVCVMPCEYSTAGCSWNGNLAASVVATSSSAVAPTATVANANKANAVAIPSTTAASTSTTAVVVAAAKSTKAKTTKSSKSTKTVAKTSSQAKATSTNEWIAVNGKNKLAEAFIDDRPPFTYDSDEGLNKSSTERVLPEADFHEVHKRSDLLLPGFGRNVYERDALVEGSFLAPLES